MAMRLSRRKLAAYVADKLQDGASAPKVLREVAAYLIDTRRTRELELLVRDIEDALAIRGTVVADITTAHALSQELKNEVNALIGAKKLQIRETIDESVLGGVRIDIPGKRFDGTIRRKLTALRAKKI
jgi:F-type H+-transporting ATPase subunit delta